MKIPEGAYVSASQIANTINDALHPEAKINRFMTSHNVEVKYIEKIRRIKIISNLDTNSLLINEEEENWTTTKE